MADEIFERRIDGVERRVERVESDTAELRREVADIRTGLATLHGDLKVNNALTATIKESVARIESNTAASFDRIEKHTRDSLDEMNAAMRDSNKKMQGAVDMATTARVMSSKPLTAFMGWVVSGLLTAFGLVAFLLKR